MSKKELKFSVNQLIIDGQDFDISTFEPTEIGDIKIPKLADIDVDFKKIDKLMREKKIVDI